VSYYHALKAKPSRFRKDLPAVVASLDADVVFWSARLRWVLENRRDEPALLGLVEGVYYALVSARDRARNLYNLERRKQ
jgi:hypothetical protein